MPEVWVSVGYVLVMKLDSFTMYEKIKYHRVSLLYIYNFSTVIDFSSEKYSGSTGHRNSSYQ